MSAVISTHTFHGRMQVDRALEVEWMRQAKAMVGSSVAAVGSALAAGRTSRMAAAQRDETTGLYNLAGLVARGGALLDESRRRSRPLGVAVFDFNDLLEVRAIYGARIASLLGRQIVRKLKMIAGAHGCVARTGKTQFAVLMPGQTRERALKVVQRVLGYPARVELDSHGEEIVLVPELVVENIAPGDESISRLHGEMLRELEQQRVAETRR
ncbi:MAG: GGDEF domain-containing protein, partial [Ramlibacter sp.]